MFSNTQESAGWRFHPSCDSSWKSLEPGGDAGEHPLQGMPRGSPTTTGWKSHFPARAGAESSQSQRPLVWAFSSRMSPAFIFDKCREDTKFIACLHKENFFSLLKRKLPQQTPPRTRSSQSRLFYLPRSWIFMAPDRGIVIIAHNEFAFQFGRGRCLPHQRLPLTPTQTFLL